MRFGAVPPIRKLRKFIKIWQKTESRSSRAQAGASARPSRAPSPQKKWILPSSITATNPRQRRRSTRSKEAGVAARYYKCDVSDFSATKETVDKIVKDFGKIDVLVNNAGITADKLIMRMDEADWDRVLSINLKGCFNMIKHVTPYMMRKRYGRIVSISSVVGLMGNAGQANYAASKAGIIGLTKTVAKEFGARNITANAVAPGFIKTAMTDALTEEQKQAMYKLIPLGCLGETQDIANAVKFLVSDDARYITGVVLKVDGGMYI